MLGKHGSRWLTFLDNNLLPQRTDRIVLFMFITFIFFFNHKICNSESKLNCFELNMSFKVIRSFHDVGHVWQTANTIFKNMSMKSGAGIRTLQTAYKYSHYLVVYRKI